MRDDMKCEVGHHVSCILASWISSQVKSSLDRAGKYFPQNMVENVILSLGR